MIRDNNVNENENEKQGYFRYVVLGIILVILGIIVTIFVKKIVNGEDTSKDIDIVGAMELAFEDEFRLYGKKIKEVKTYYPRESGGEPYTVIAEYNQDGKIAKMLVESDNGKLNEIVDVEYENVGNGRIVTWVWQGTIIKKMEYVGLTKTKETYYDDNGQISKVYEYESDRSYNGKNADYVYDRMHGEEYIYVHEKYENEALNKEQDLYTIYYRKSATSQWEYRGKKICDKFGHVIEQDLEYGEMFEKYTYEYSYDNAGSETGYKKYKDKELISVTEIEYFN